VRYFVVGGHARGVGKTALVVDVIRAFPGVAWTAVKITEHPHGARLEQNVSGSGPPEGILEEEFSPEPRTDTSRYLAAGARRSFWLRVRPGRLAEAMPLLHRALESAESVILESNSVLEHIHPGLFVMVLDPAAEEFKDSARRFLPVCDAFLTRGPIAPLAWGGLGQQIAASHAVFRQPLGAPLPSGLLSLIRNRLSPAMHPRTTGGHLPR